METNLRCNCCQKYDITKLCAKCDLHMCVRCAEIHVNINNHINYLCDNLTTSCSLDTSDDLISLHSLNTDSLPNRPEHIEIGDYQYSEGSFKSLRSNNTHIMSHCSNCKSTFTNKVYMLSCMHNLCGTCFFTMGGSATTTCLLCNNETNNDDVVRNSFIENMNSIQSMIKRSRSEANNCELCAPEVVSAVNYCVECYQYFCSKCSSKHLKTRTCLNHNVVDKNNVDEIVFKSQHHKCEKHGQDLTMHCKECDALICSVCCAMNHADHNKDDDVKQIFEKSKESIRMKLETIDKLVRKQQSHEKENEKMESKLKVKVDAIRAEIDTRARQLKELTDKIHFKLIKNLDEYKNDYIKIHLKKSIEIRDYLSALNTYKIYMQNVIDNGTNTDVYNLNKNFDKNNFINNNPPSTVADTDLSYYKSTIDSKLFNPANLFGFLKDSKIFDLRNKVTSSCIVDNCLYAIDNINKCIDKYDIDSLIFKSSIDCSNYITHVTFSLITAISDILFMYCYFKDNRDQINKTIIYKLNFDTERFDEWKTLERCDISSTHRGTVLVRTYNCISEYSVEGQQLKTFKIPDNAVLQFNSYLFSYFNITHEMNDKRYVVTSDDNDNLVLICLLDAEGKFIKSFATNTTAVIRSCTDGAKYIFLLEYYTGLIRVLSNELQQIDEFKIPDAFHISYDRKYDKIMVVTSKEIHYINYIY